MRLVGRARGVNAAAAAAMGAYNRRWRIQSAILTSHTLAGCCRYRHDKQWQSERFVIAADHVELADVWRQTHASRDGWRTGRRIALLLCSGPHTHTPADSACYSISHIPPAESACNSISHIFTSWIQSCNSFIPYPYKLNPLATHIPICWIYLQFAVPYSHQLNPLALQSPIFPPAEFALISLPHIPIIL